MAAASHTDAERGTEKKLEAANTLSPSPTTIRFSQTRHQKWPVRAVKLPTLNLSKHLQLLEGTN